MADREVRLNHQAENDPKGQATTNLHSGSKPEHWTNSPVMPPIYISTTFETLEPGKADYEYSRSDNPTRAELQKQLAALEDASYGLAFSSGLGSLTTVVYGLVQAGEHVICCDDVYGGTNRFFSRCASRLNIETSFVGGTKVSDWVEKFQFGKTKLVWIETPTNPTMKLVDIQQVSSEVKKLDPNCIIVVDSTFMTPVFQSPLKLGADIVMHSVTKFINGHSDVIMGALMTNNTELYGKLKFFQNALGIVPSAFDCSMVMRSIKTLENRVRQQASTALELARWLEQQPEVERVLYPGLESHPQYSLAVKQCSGFSSIISIYLKQRESGSNEATRVLQSVGIFHSAVSLGCVCSLIQLPQLMTHSAIPGPELARLGISENLLRLSIGLENVHDLKRDLRQALDLAYAK